MKTVYSKRVNVTLNFSSRRDCQLDFIRTRNILSPLSWTRHNVLFAESFARRIASLVSYCRTATHRVVRREPTESNFQPSPLRMRRSCEWKNFFQQINGRALAMRMPDLSRCTLEHAGLLSALGHDVRGPCVIFNNISTVHDDSLTTFIRKNVAKNHRCHDTRLPSLSLPVGQTLARLQCQRFVFHG